MFDPITAQLTVEFLWDVQKAFDQVDRAMLFRKARDLGYPMHVLRLSLDSYGFERRLIDRDIVSRPLAPAKGIGQHRRVPLRDPISRW